jgi:xanthine dehydrogenase YagR molybdenum-binding subunit
VNPEPREELEITVGFGKHTEKRKVTVPDGDAPPWDANTRFAVVGTDHDRVDGLLKASGRAKYTYDINLPGMLYGLIVRSSVPRGKLVSLELDDARKMPGVAAIVRLKEDGNKLRFVGDALVAIAAATLDQARDAAEKVKANCEAEEHNVDFLQAEHAPLVDDHGSVLDEWPKQEKVEAALAAAAVTLTGSYRTEVQTHSSLETHGAVARWNGDDLEVWASSQATFGFRGELADAMKNRGYKVSSVALHAEFVGGGFGSKFTSGVEGLACCALAREANAPVKLMLDRFEEHSCTGYRPGSLMQIRAGADKSGKITAWDFRSFGQVGFNGGGGNVVYPLHYVESADKHTDHKDLTTDTDAARPMRAPSWPQGYFGGELFLDELAAALNMDPLALRLVNDKQVIRIDEWQLGADRFGWSKARNPKPGAPIAGDDARYLRGAGLASARWGGMGGDGRPAHGSTCRIHADGSVEARSGAQDIGTGMKTVMAIVTAEELGIAPSQVKVTMGHTDDPSGPASGGSTTTPSLSPVVRHAAFLAKQDLAKLVAKHLGVEPSDIVFADGKVGAPKQAGKPMLSFAEACKLIGPNPIEARGKRFANYKEGGFNNGVCGCQFAEVQVDTWTGMVRVLRMLAVQDCGIVIAKKLAESQVLGAMIQGISYALHEQRILDRRSGRMVNGDFLRYKITGPADMPPMECIMVSVANGHTNTGAVGLGEPPSVAAPAAVANAVFNAIGVPVRHLPITPDKVLKALSQRKGA